MLTNMKVFSASLLDPTTFAFDDEGSANLDKIQIHNVDGLGPVKATINTTQYGNINGSYFTGSSIGERNIVITVGLHPDWAEYTIEELRQVLYQYFMPQQWVELHFETTHLPEVAIKGIVEDLVPNMFTQEPEIQISIICPDPDFVAVESVVVEGRSVPQSMITYTEIAYSGSVDTPINLTLRAPQYYGGPLYILNHGISDEGFSMESSISIGQSIVYDSTEGARQVSLVGHGVTYNLMRLVDPGGSWIKMHPGKNNFAVVTRSDTGLLWELKYTPRLGGL